MKLSNPRRVRQFMYTQDIAHLKIDQKQLRRILNASGAIEWAYIKHDKDVDKDGKLIRPHYHVVLKYEYPQSILSIATLFKDQTQYVEIWSGRIANAYSYLIHETTEAVDKHHYQDNEVVASFDFHKKMEEIRKKIKKSPKYVMEMIERYANKKMTYDELAKELGVMPMAKHQQLIDRISQVQEDEAHNKWLDKVKGKKMLVLWLYGPAGVGKTRMAEIMFAKYKYVILGSSRDYFQDYHGEHYIILNDLRPNDFQYSDLLRLLDPYQHDKAAPSRYHDKKLSAEKIIITTPYSPKHFYKNIFGIQDKKVDTVDQLLRRVIPIEITPEFFNSVLKKRKARSNRDKRSNSHT
ncbi:Rep family protein [Lactobacillus taiwanensis]|uniref:Rep family protein n=1 Tax=Lactobacillus taiwanensis TaxID=508451 RepID=UPI00353033BE